jgi:hypothetical protein
MSLKFSTAYRIVQRLKDVFMFSTPQSHMMKHEIEFLSIACPLADDINKQISNVLR